MPISLTPSWKAHITLLFIYLLASHWPEFSYMAKTRLEEIYKYRFLPFSQNAEKQGRKGMGVSLPVFDIG